MFHLSGQKDVYIGIGYRHQGKKEPASSMIPIMQGLVKDAIYVSQGGIKISGGDAAYQWNCSWRMSLPTGMIKKYEPQMT